MIEWMYGAMVVGDSFCAYTYMMSKVFCVGGRILVN